jgi:hypothetical protein
MTTATSLILIAVGAILAFAVSTQVAGINIQTVGLILIVVGGIGLAIAMATLAGYAPWGAARGVAQEPNGTPPATAGPANVTAPVIVTPPANPAPPRA